MTGVQTCALRSEEHTSELQSHDNLVCRLLLEKNRLHGLVVRRLLAAALPPRAPRRGRRSPGSRGAAGAAWVARRSGPAVTSSFFNDTATTETPTPSLHWAKSV